VLLAVASAWLLPVLIEAQSINTTGVIWQGRYTLPLFVGVPLLSAVTLGCRRGRRAPLVERSSAIITGVIAGFCLVGIAVLQVLAFRFALHRHVDGLGNTLSIPLDGPWQPRLGAARSLFLAAVWWSAGCGAVAFWGWGPRRFARPRSLM
jgi:hypothetical protein